MRFLIGQSQSYDVFSANQEPGGKWICRPHTVIYARWLDALMRAVCYLAAYIDDDNTSLSLFDSSLFPLCWQKFNHVVSRNLINSEILYFQSKPTCVSSSVWHIIPWNSYTSRLLRPLNINSRALKGPLSCGFDSSIGGALHRKRKCRGFESHSKPEFGNYFSP